MDFKAVHALIPYETEGEKHSNTLNVYKNVRVKYPGTHAMDTTPVGGDFVVEVFCHLASWNWKQFTHTDIFNDIQLKTDFAPDWMREWFAPRLAQVVDGTSIPMVFPVKRMPGVEVSTLLEASQCLAIAEHRRYHKYEAGGGGRYLPLRFTMGIIYGHWNASDASRVQRRGIHGYRQLTKEFGNPPTVRKLIKENVA